MRDYQDDYRRAVQVFRRIAVDTLADGGGTYQRATGASVTHSDGYYVGVGNVATFHLPFTTVDEIRLAVQSVWPTTLPHDAQYVGTWFDGEYLYVDYVTHVQDRAIALALAARHGERAIYDCATGTSIPVV